MEVALFQDIATIVTFLAPGYFAIQMYSLIYTKRDRDFSRLVIESIIYSLPITAAATGLWLLLFNDPPSSLSIGYIMLLIVLALGIGVAVAYLRMHWPLKQIAQLLGLGLPHEDFVKSQLKRIDTTQPHTSAVTVQLKSGSAFSGTIDQMSDYNHDGRPMYISFANVAWFNDTTDKWEVRDGNIVIARDEIEYIETSKLADK